MGTSPLVYVNGSPLPQPSTYKANTATMVDAARNAEGRLIGAPIREHVSKIELTWRFLSVADWSNILQRFSGSFSNSITYFDQDRGGWVNKTMYVSDRDADVPFPDRRTGHPVAGWTNARIALIEV